MQKTVNIHETDGGRVTVALPKGLRADLIAMRVRHGSQSPIGHRCSNIIESCRAGASIDSINRQVLELARLMAR